MIARQVQVLQTLFKIVLKADFFTFVYYCYTCTPGSKSPLGGVHVNNRQQQVWVEANMGMGQSLLLVWLTEIRDK